MDDIDWEGLSRRLKEWVEGNYANLSKNSTLPTEERDDSNALISSALGVVGVNNEAINQDISEGADWAKRMAGRFTESVGEKRRRELAERLQAQDEERIAQGLPDPNSQVDIGMAAPNSQYTPYYTGQLDTIKPEPTEAPATEEDYLNQLLMASLMKGRKPTYGRQAPSSYGVGATVPFGDAWKMRRTIGGH